MTPLLIALSLVQPIVGETERFFINSSTEAHIAGATLVAFKKATGSRLLLAITTMQSPPQLVAILQAMEKDMIMVRAADNSACKIQGDFKAGSLGQELLTQIFPLWRPEPNPVSLPQVLIDSFDRTGSRNLFMVTTETSFGAQQGSVGVVYKSNGSRYKTVGWNFEPETPSSENPGIYIMSLFDGGVGMGGAVPNMDLEAAWSKHRPSNQEGFKFDLSGIAFLSKALDSPERKWLASLSLAKLLALQKLL